MAPSDDMEMTLLPRNNTRSTSFHRDANPDDDGVSVGPEHGESKDDSRLDSTHDGGFDVRPDDTQTHTTPGSSRVFLKLLSFWIGTIVFTALVVAIVTMYKAKDVLTPAEKSTFNISLTVLILVLGLSFFVSITLKYFDIHD